MRLVLKDRRLLVRDRRLLVTADVTRCPCCGGGESCGCTSDGHNDEFLGSCQEVGTVEDPVSCGNVIDVSIDGVYETTERFTDEFGGGVRRYRYVAAVGARWHLERAGGEFPTCNTWDQSRSSATGYARLLQRSYDRFGNLLAETDDAYPVRLADAPVPFYGQCSVSSDGAFYAIANPLPGTDGLRQLWVSFRLSGTPALVEASKLCSTNFDYTADNGTRIAGSWSMASSRSGDSYSYDYAEDWAAGPDYFGFYPVSFRGLLDFDLTVVQPCESGRSSRPNVQEAADVLRI